MQMVPVRPATVEPGCLLPGRAILDNFWWILIIYHSENFTGEWINTANIDADVVINSTHIIEKWNPDVGRWRKVVYICVEQRDSRYMMARLTVDGWWVVDNNLSEDALLTKYFSSQVDYQCVDYVPRHHNIIRWMNINKTNRSRHRRNLCWL